MKRRMIAIVFLLASNLSIAQVASRTAPVTGTVLDPSGASAPDAIVMLKRSNGRVLARTRTGLLGEFRLEAVPPGNYSVEVQHEGFQNSITPLRVSSNPPLPLTITLALEKVTSEVSVDEAESAQVSSDVGENQNAPALH